VRCLTAVDVVKFGSQKFLTMFEGYCAFRSDIQETLTTYKL
jgi:hypothetical protein